MLAPTQRRRFLKYISLPIVVAIVLLVTAKLIALQRADILAELADRVAHCDSPQAAAAVRQLATMPAAPVSILVLAATSANAEAEEEAKQCIGQLLRRAQRQIERGRGLGSVARQLAELAESLDAQHSMFSTADDPWLSSTTRKLLRLANRIPPGQTPLVAVHCDAILARIASKEAASRNIADSEPEVEESFVDEGAMIDANGQLRQAQARGAMPVALAPRVVHGSSEPAQGANGSLRSIPSTPQPQSVARKRAEVSERIAESASAGTSPEELMHSPWRASWSHPIFRMMPAQPMNAPSTTDDAPAGVPRSSASEAPPADPEAGDPPLAGIDARELLRRWLDADGREIFPLEEELTRRGFGRLSERFVQQLFSPKSEDRLAFVDAVLTEPGIDARPWLVLLSQDSEADVRLLAVTIMATSNDAALVDKAWQVSIRDRDPRIARLAGRLRERRESAQR